VTYLTDHLPPWTLEELAEGTLSPAETVGALQHVRACERCTAELDASRAVLAALAALPSFDPSPGFADRVMAQVVVHPAVAPAPAGLRRWLPKTRKGWTFLLGGILAPVAPVVALLTWILGYPGVSIGSLWGVGKEWLTEAAWGAVVRATEAVVQSPVFEWMVTTGNEAVGGTQGLSLALILFAIAIPVSGWAMLRLLRTPMGGVTHAY
jgi:hypothetical protein